MDASLLEVLKGISRQLESLDGKVASLAEAQAAQGQGLAEVRRGLDELRLLVPAQPAKGAPAAAAGPAAAAAAGAGQQALEPPVEGVAAAHDAGPLPDDSEMPDAPAEQPAAAAERRPAAAGSAPPPPRMQHNGGAQPAGEGPPAAAPEAAARSAEVAAASGQSPRRGRRRLQPQRMSPQPQPPSPREEAEPAAEEAAVGAGQGPFPAKESFRPDQVLKSHEDFIAAALPRRPPGWFAWAPEVLRLRVAFHSCSARQCACDWFADPSLSVRLPLQCWSLQHSSAAACQPGCGSRRAWSLHLLLLRRRRQSSRSSSRAGRPAGQPPS